MDSRTVKQYLDRVEASLPLSGLWKRRFLRDLQQDITRYTTRYVKADMHQLEQRFGTPAEIAAGIEAEMPEEARRCKGRTLNRVISIVLGLALFFTVGGVGFTAWMTKGMLNSSVGYCVVGEAVITYREEHKT